MSLIRWMGILAVCGCMSCAHERVPEPMGQKAATQYQFAYDSFVAGDLIPALAAALKAVEFAPNNPDAHNLLGLIYFRQEKYAQAEVEFKDAISLNPKMSEAYNNLGTLLYQTKRYTESRVMLEKALENPLYLYPERIYNNLGLSLQAMGQTSKAIEAYEKSMSLRDDFYLPYQNLGKLLMELGQSARAKKLLQEASRLCLDCSEPRYFLGQILVKENKMEEALRIFKEGAEKDPRGYYGQLCNKFVVKE